MSYIKKETLLEEVSSLEQLARKRVYDTPTNSPCYERYCTQMQDRGTILSIIKAQPTADVVAVVRCKDCKHFQPDFVMTGDGDRRPYTDEEIKNGKIVTGDVGINCASRCERFGYWEENKIPVWFSENDYCSYGERSENGKS